MKATAGQLLLAELKRQRIGKTELAKLVGRTYATVNNWTKDKGFEPSARIAAARALKLPSDAFDAPSSTDLREQHRRKVLEEFFQDPTFADLTDEERYTIESIVLPKNSKATVGFYEMFTYLMRNKLEHMLPEVVATNQAIDASIRRKLEEHAAKPGASKGKRNPKRGPAR